MDAIDFFNHYNPDTQEFYLLPYQRKILKRMEINMDQSRCPLKFKGHACGYTGPGSWCDKTYIRCRKLGNQKSYVYGEFKTTPDIYKKRCHYLFKGHICQYSGAQIQCDKTFSRCKELGNEHRFPLGWRVDLYNPNKEERSKAKMNQEPVIEQRKTFQPFIAVDGDLFGEEVIWTCTLFKKVQKNGHIILKTSRGVAICSELDEPCSDTGKQIAESYAVLGMNGREPHRDVTCSHAVDVLLNTDCPFTKHIESNPKLTFQEQKKLFGKKFTGSPDNLTLNGLSEGWNFTGAKSG